MLATVIFLNMLWGAWGNPELPQLLQVFPPAGATSVQVKVIGAELNFTKGETADPTSLQLFVDGEDVTSQSTITQTRDWPPSFVSISHIPTQLQAGLHHAEIRFKSDKNVIFTYRWSFIFQLNS